MTLLKIEDLKVAFGSGNSTVIALRGVNLDIRRNEILGLAGESGCGKTVCALSITKLLSKNANILNGRIMFEDSNLLELDDEQLRKIRGSKISYIFQNPTASFNPVFTIGEQITESIKIHQNKNALSAKVEALRLLDLVAMPRPREIIPSYPHQLSGGMNQRAMIAMALANKAQILIADEPTTSLDVTIESQILNLLSKLKKDLGISILLITHNLKILKKIADRIAIMKEGRIIEVNSSDGIFNNPGQDYTKSFIELI